MDANYHPSHSDSQAHSHSHSHSHGHQGLHQTKPKEAFSLAFSATVHCLIGCGIGEVLGIIIGTALAMGMWETMLLGVSLGFVMGLALGILPLWRAGFGIAAALRVVVVAEGLSIVVMEAFEVLTQILVPGVMEAGLGDGIFWFGMFLSLIAGFVAAFPVNLILVRKGIRHQH